MRLISSLSDAEMFMRNEHNNIVKKFVDMEWISCVAVKGLTRQFLHLPPQLFDQLFIPPISLKVLERKNKINLFSLLSIHTNNSQWSECSKK